MRVKMLSTFIRVDVIDVNHAQSERNVHNDKNEQED